MAKVFKEQRCLSKAMNRQGNKNLQGEVEREREKLVQLFLKVLCHRCRRRRCCCCRRRCRCYLLSVCDK